MDILSEKIQIQDFIIYQIIAAVIIFWLGRQTEKIAAGRRRRAWQQRNRGNWEERKRKNGDNVISFQRQPQKPRSTTIDAADQLRIVMGAQFSIQPLLNRSEARVFKELDRMVLDCNPNWQVMAQVSLGEILNSEDPAAYGCVNSKRIDLLLVDENCHPKHAIEYQGTGHHQGTAAARDAVKKEALRRAGIG